MTAFAACIAAEVFCDKIGLKKGWLGSIEEDLYYFAPQLQPTTTNDDNDTNEIDLEIIHDLRE